MSLSERQRKKSIITALDHCYILVINIVALGGLSSGSVGSLSDDHTWRRVSSPQRMI